MTKDSRMTVIVKLHPDQHARVHKAAERKGLSISVLLRQLGLEEAERAEVAEAATMPVPRRRS